MTQIRVARTVSIPDLMRISRYQKTPELGPSLLFFSGGTALDSLCRTLKSYTHNSIHLVTPFDSGGSSAKLRKAFNMPAIGDLRSRLMALADETVLGHPEIYQLFTYRLPVEHSPKQLHRRLHNIASGDDELVLEIAAPMRRLICHQLSYFLQAMPDDFDLSGASIGNLILAGGYLTHHKHLDPIIFLFSKLVNVQGTVRTIVNDDYHLGVELANGDHVIGQHKITGKEVAPLTSPVTHLFLSEHPQKAEPVKARLRKRNRKLIGQADLICYPPGSFYSSIIANLLPQGVGRNIAANDCPKVYIPNLGQDPEQIGMTLEQSLNKLLYHLKEDAGRHVSTQSLLNFVLLDSKNAQYSGGVPYNLLEQEGIQLIDVNLVSKSAEFHYDEHLLVSALLSLC